MTHAYSDIWKFWFGDYNEPSAVPTPSASWFMPSREFDRQIEVKFGNLWREVAGASELVLESTPRGRLAQILLLDQFSRNLHRGSSLAFSQDPRALALAQESLSRGDESVFLPFERSFLYLPFEHSEDLAIQDESVRYFQQLCEDVPESLRQEFESNLDYAVRHRNIIARFGRFPHRNAVLGRESSAEEKAFLLTPGSSF